MREILKRLGSDYEECLSSFSAVSCDDSNGTRVIMVDAEREVINFDKSAQKHAELNNYKQVFQSNDALIVRSDGTLLFIEFKNGKTKNLKLEELRAKACESVVLAMNLKIVESLDEVKSRVDYMLVFTERKRIDSAHLELAKLAGKKMHPRAIDSFEWIFRNVDSYTAKEFEDKVLGTL